MKLPYKFKRNRRRIKKLRQIKRQARRRATRVRNTKHIRQNMAARRERHRKMMALEKNAAIYENLVNKGKELELPATQRIVQRCLAAARANIGKRKQTKIA